MALKTTQTPCTQFHNGLAISYRNTVLSDKNNKGFYVSYAPDLNNTALVICRTTLPHLTKLPWQSVNFYSLKGDHLEKYKEAYKGQLQDCINYFLANIHVISPLSQDPQELKD